MEYLYKLQNLVDYFSPEIIGKLGLRSISKYVVLFMPTRCQCCFIANSKAVVTKEDFTCLLIKAVATKGHGSSFTITEMKKT